MRTIILAAEKAEFEMCRKFFPDMECVCTGVGAGNVIKTCSQLPEGVTILNIGYAGSNCLEIGTVCQVSQSYRLTDGNYVFTDYANPLDLSKNGYPCYTNNSFVTSSDKTEPTLFDMELNYIAAFTHRFEKIISVKIVSDNLNVDAFRNNAIRESGILTCDEVWSKVKAEVDKILNA